MLIATQEQVDLVSKLLALNVIIQRQFTTLRGLLVDVWVVKSILTRQISLWRYKLMTTKMKTYHIECMETNTFVVEVEAQNEDEARELAHNDINSFEVVKECVSDWEINLVEEVL